MQLMKFVRQWPKALVVAGIILSVVWLAILIWVPLRLLEIV
jgi:hypothetical protein